MAARDRDKDASIQTALEDLMRERDLVDDAIDKLQKLLVNLRMPASKQRRSKAVPRSRRRVSNSARS